MIALLLILLTLPSFAYSGEALQAASQQTITQQLGWVSEKNSSNLCKGHYDNSPLMLQDPLSVHQLAQSEKGAKAQVTAAHMSLFTQKRRLLLQGHACFKQPLQQLCADKAILIADPKTERILVVTLEGHIRIEMPGRLILAQHAVVDLKKHTVQADQVYYRFLKRSKKHIVNPWGKAKTLEINQKKGVMLTQASYSSCPISHKTWQLKAHRIQLNPITGLGRAISTMLFIKSVPVAYFPYLVFPTDKRRRTGFLLPNFGYTTQGGLEVSLPFYFNLAPNYDLKLIPSYIEHRGLLWQIRLRYLSRISTSQFRFMLLPDDRVFAEFRRQAPFVFQGIPEAELGLRELNSNHNTRYAIGIKHRIVEGDSFLSRIDINLASDAYLFYDFGNLFGLEDVVHLLNRFETVYTQEHWRFSTKLQAHQTLHAITKDRIHDLYSRLPEIKLDVKYPHLADHINLSIETEAIHFDHKRDVLTGQPIVGGVRIKLNPSIAFPWHTSAGFLTPRLQLMLKNYWLREGTESTAGRQGEILPILNVDTGIHLARYFDIKGHRYEQILSPRLFYLYVPFRDQNRLPIFDTKSLPFSFAQLFRTNRFIGYDRVGDANQISFGIANKVVDVQSGSEIWNMRLGTTYYLSKHRVCLSKACITDFTIDRNFSPLIAEFQYHNSKYWSISSTLSWNIIHHYLDHGYVNLLYQPWINHHLSLKYYYVRRGDIIEALPIESAQNHLNRASLSLNWPFKEHWNFLGSWGYNISHQHAESYLYGIEYQGCCWAARAVAYNSFRGIDGQGNRSYQHRYFIQLQLKGLGQLSNYNMGPWLERQIPGYVNRLS